MVQLKIVAAIFGTLCLLVPPISSNHADVNYCRKKANYAVKVSGIEISPFPISRSVNTTFAVAACTSKVISGGTLSIDVAYFGFSIHSESHDLCKKTTCPVPNGDFMISHSQVLPGITPPGSYTLKMTLADSSKKQLTCFTFDFSIGFMSSEGLAES